MGSKRGGKKKAAAVAGTGAGVGGVLLLVGVVIVVRLLGGPDLSGLLTGETGTAGTNTATTDREPVARGPAPAPVSADAPAQAQPTRTAAPGKDDAGVVARLFRDGVSDEMVTLPGLVSRVLPDDNEGSRHQKFILTLSSGHTVLISHNIDLAPRVPLDRGDRVVVRGEYEWTERGGVVHWTHHDPKKWREGGWIEHEGTRYE